jgi:hypothetical protein
MENEKTNEQFEKLYAEFEKSKFNLKYIGELEKSGKSSF